LNHTFHHSKPFSELRGCARLMLVARQLIQFFWKFIATPLGRPRPHGILERYFALVFREDYSTSRGFRSSPAIARWGVVQLVGHLTVNEDGEGSNPSAPANFSTVFPVLNLVLGYPAVFASLLTGL
jgi:hypothetical protein